MGGVEAAYLELLRTGYCSGKETYQGPSEDWRTSVAEPWFRAIEARAAQDGLRVKTYEGFDNMGMGWVSPAAELVRPDATRVRDHPNRERTPLQDSGYVLMAARSRVGLPVYMMRLGRREGFSHLSRTDRKVVKRLRRLPALRDFNRQLPRAIARAERERQPLSLFALDIAKLVLINDQQGHMAGDGVLDRTYEALKDLFRESGNVYRVAADEFWAILPGITLEVARQTEPEATRAVAAANAYHDVEVCCATAEHRIGESAQELAARLTATLKPVQLKTRRDWLRNNGFASLLDD